MTFAVVYTSGRTGSTIICDNLANGNTGLSNTEWPDIGNKPSIIHCHNPFYQPPFKTICIISKRRNVLESIMSKEIASQTHEYYVYSGKQIQPFKLNIDYVYRSYVIHDTFYKLINLGDRVQHIIYYEDLIKNPFSLFSKFGINKAISLNADNKSPYNYKDIIINYKELEEAYNDFMNTDVPKNMFEWAKTWYVNDVNQKQLKFLSKESN